ncbi:hypothetical protein LCGC14_0405260 [marine sediment metagenome]|uniref:Uncharacterized protein n=1 Tax=marine sediment metagenome TaxID=412755 RepID=A0A0F9TDI5_9ZZZZ
MSEAEDKIQEIVDFISQDRLITENPESFLSWLKQTRKTQMKNTIKDLINYAEDQCNLLQKRPPNSYIEGLYPMLSVNEQQLLDKFIECGDLYDDLASKVTDIRFNRDVAGKNNKV